jgi:hypothetical protein
MEEIQQLKSFDKNTSFYKTINILCDIEKTIMVKTTHDNAEIRKYL